MPIPLAQIKHTGLRRAAMIAVAPIGALYVSPQFVMIVWSCLCEALDGFVEEWGFQTEELGLISKAWTALWSKDWKPSDADQ